MEKSNLLGKQSMEKRISDKASFMRAFQLDIERHGRS